MPVVFYRKQERAIGVRQLNLEMMQGSQSHLLYGSAISAISKQQVEADQKGQHKGQNAQQHAFMVAAESLELIKQVG